jgi:hypothetical protein
MLDLVHNEKLKLRATFLNNFGIALTVAAYVAPSFLFGEGRIAQLIGIGTALAVCLVFHWRAMKTLEGLRG